MRPHLRAALIAALAGVPIALAGVVTTGGTPAAATDCHTIKITSTDAVTTSGGGEATLTPDGLIMSTPEQSSKVSYRKTLGNPVPLSKITALGYTTDRQDGATGDARIVAAYKLGVDANGDSTIDGTLVYEPLYSGDVTADEQRHNALDGKWWYSAEPGNRQTLATFAEWTAGTGPVAFPAPEARWFGVEQGTYNTGAITLIDDVKFAGDGVCKRVEFCPAPTTPPTTPTGTPTATPTTTRPTTPPPTTTAPPPATTAPPVDPTPTATATPPENEEPAAPPADGTGGGDSLPVTGSPVAYAAGGGAALLAAGLGVLFLMRRRRTRYVA